MMKRFRKIIPVFFATFLLVSAYAVPASAWSDHELILMPVYKSMPEVANAKPVNAETLGSFLATEGKGLESLLKSDEEWNRKNLKNYRPLPDALLFKATNDPNEAIKRFCDAIRISDRYYYALYIRLMPGDSSSGKATVKGSGLTYLKDLSDIDDRTYIRLLPGEQVSVLDVLGTASDEPDLGIDIGLFDDNDTEQGKKLNFGKQPFGNPNLEYSSQAPFHMGFYNEAGIVYALAGFLKETYPEYRIHMCMVLSEYAFKTGHDYWGWRFMGWGMHYLSDLSMPYHAVVLPGVSTCKMLWINTKAMIGFPQAKNNAIQLVSNRHGALEKYQKYAIRDVYDRNDMENEMLSLMTKNKKQVVYDNDSIRKGVSKLSAKRAKETDKMLVKCMPDNYVNDPKVEFNDIPGTDKILDTVRNEKGQGCIDNMNKLLGELYVPAAVYGRAYIEAIIKAK